RPIDTKSRCFDPFPFPDPVAPLGRQLRHAGEELDALRWQVLARHPDLTLTGLYNVLEKLKAEEALTAAETDVKERGLVVVLRELHDLIDRLTMDAYGWPHDLSGHQIVQRLVALNAERAREEADGRVRWLRPDYQKRRFGRAISSAKELDLVETVIAI